MNWKHITIWMCKEFTQRSPSLGKSCFVNTRWMIRFPHTNQVGKTHVNQQTCILLDIRYFPHERKLIRKWHHQRIWKHGIKQWKTSAKQDSVYSRVQGKNNQKTTLETFSTHVFHFLSIMPANNINYHGSSGRSLLISVRYCIKLRYDSGLASVSKLDEKWEQDFWRIPPPLRQRYHNFVYHSIPSKVYTTILYLHDTVKA